MKTKFMTWTNIILGSAMVIVSLIWLVIGTNGSSWAIEPFEIQFWFDSLSATALVLFIIGMIALLAGLLEIITEKNQSKQEKIESNDERNIAIVNAAAAGAFDLLSSLLFLVILALLLLGYLSTVAFITLLVVYTTCQIFYVIRRRWINYKN